eukprot:366247-Chlamydomonas_euryale.AAC.9
MHARIMGSACSLRCCPVFSPTSRDDARENYTGCACSRPCTGPAPRGRLDRPPPQGLEHPRHKVRHCPGQFIRVGCQEPSYVHTHEVGGSVRSAWHVGTFSADAVSRHGHEESAKTSGSRALQAPRHSTPDQLHRIEPYHGCPILLWLLFGCAQAHGAEVSRRLSRPGRRRECTAAVAAQTPPPSSRRSPPLSCGRRARRCGLRDWPWRSGDVA